VSVVTAVVGLRPTARGTEFRADRL